MFVVVVVVSFNNYLGVRTTTTHCSAKENVHQQHDEEEYAQSNGQPEQPWRVNGVLASTGDH